MFLLNTQCFIKQQNKDFMQLILAPHLLSKTSFVVREFRDADEKKQAEQKQAELKPTLSLKDTAVLCRDTCHFIKASILISPNSKRS